MGADVDVRVIRAALVACARYVTVSTPVCIGRLLAQGLVKTLMSIIKAMNLDGVVLENVDAIRHANMMPVAQYLLSSLNSFGFKASRRNTVVCPISRVCTCCAFCTQVIDLPFAGLLDKH